MYQASALHLSLRWRAYTLNISFFRNLPAILLGTTISLSKTRDRWYWLLPNYHTDGKVVVFKDLNYKMISASWNCILFCVKSMVVYSDQRGKHIKLVHPSTPISDRQNISLQYQYNINKISNENKKNINLGISWSNTKFSELTS